MFLSFLDSFWTQNRSRTAVASGNAPGLDSPRSCEAQSRIECVNNPIVETARSIEPKATLILGGSGFIGTRLAALMSERQLPFHIGDLRPSLSYPNVWTECDVRKLESLKRTVADCSAVINLAAEHRDDVHPISRYHETNVVGAEQVCTAARDANVGKIVFTSSAAVYGFHAHAVDENGPFTPFNAYGKTKLEAEFVYRQWAAEDPSRTLVIVRPTVVFGEGNRGNVYNLLRQIESGRFFMVGSGKNVKSIAYVGNLVAFLVHSLSLQPGVHVFNYVDLPDITTKELVDHVSLSVGRSGRTPSLPRPIAMIGAQVLDTVARLTGRTFPISAVRIRKFCESTQFRADRALQSGFVPPYSLREGLDRTLRSEFSDTTDEPQN
jgi:GlcNAc-P-P-Und epimerase